MKPIASPKHSNCGGWETVFGRLPCLIGILVAAFGLLIAISWQAHWQAFLQMLPQTAPMRFNTALCFMLSGTGLFLLTTPKNRTVPWLGATMVLLNVMTLVEHVTGRNLGIDELLLKPYFKFTAINPGRMSPLATICFMMIGTAFILAGSKLHREKCLTIIGVLANIVLAVVSVALAGYIFQIESAYDWGSYARMAINTAVTLIIFSCGLLIWAWQAARQNHHSFLRWLPVTGAATLILMVTFISAVNMTALKGATAWRKHTYEVIDSAQTFQSDYIEMQRNVRGYITLGTPELLAAFQKNTNSWGGKFFHLADLTLDNASQKTRINQLAGAVHDVMDYDADIIGVYQHSGPQGVLQLDSTGRGRTVTGHALDAIKAFADEEKSLLIQRDAKEQTDYRCVENLMIFGGALSAILLVVANSMASRELKFRYRAEAQLQEFLSMQKAILHSADYGIVSTELDGIIRTFNPAAEKLLGYTADEVIGKKTPLAWREPLELAERARKISNETGESVQPNFEAVVANVKAKQVDEGEWTFIRKNGSRFTSLLVVTAVVDEAGQSTGYLGVFRDITDRKQFEAERETLIMELRTALAQVKTLSGLIPICGWCKNVRSDKGFWQTVEQYVHSHTDASFTHGICPTCQEKFLADVAKSNSKRA